MTMVAKILDGKACAAAVEESLKERINKCQVAGITPHIAVIIVGDDPASHVYVGANPCLPTIGNQEHSHRNARIIERN